VGYADLFSLIEISIRNDHEVKFNITFRPLSQLLEAGSAYVGSPELNGSLYIDYVYLDTDERRQFAQVQHENYVLKSKHQKCLLVTVM
jgi:hypothetical protein